MGVRAMRTALNGAHRAGTNIRTLVVAVTVVALLGVFVPLVPSPGASAAPLPSSDTDGEASGAAVVGAGAPTPPDSSVAFDDVPAEATFSQGVAWLLDKDITQGQGGRRKYSPAGTVLRVQMALFLWRMMGTPEVGTSPCGFTDMVSRPQDQIDATCWLKQERITTGINPSQTLFGPDRGVTREEMAGFLLRLASVPGGETSCGFSDSPAKPEFAAGACWLKANGITTGTNPAGTAFSPKALVTRGQMAAFLFRLVGAADTAWSVERLAPAMYDCSALDTSQCLLPFPNDQFSTVDPSTDTGIRLDLARTSTPANKSGRRIDPYEQNRNDGFSPGQAVLVNLPGVDLARTGVAPIDDMGRSLEPDSPVMIINAATGDRHPHWVEIDSLSTPDDGQMTHIRPAVNFDEGARYIVVLRNLRDAAGDPAPDVSAAFAAHRDGLPTGVAVVEALRPRTELLLDELVDLAVPTDGLYLVWDFTVASARNLSERVLHVRDDAFDRLGLAAPKVTIRQVNPAGDQSGGGGGSDDCVSFACVFGTVEVPNYLTGTGQPGSSFNWGPDGLPQQNTTGAGRSSTVEALFTCVIPPSATPANRARPSLYGHGLLGASVEVIFASGQAAVEDNMVFCAADWWGMSAFDIGNVTSLLGDLSRFNTLADRGQQGFLNFLFLGRALVMGMNTNVELGCTGPPCDPASPLLSKRPVTSNPFLVGGQSIIDTSDLFYVGNSQGGIKGGALMAIGQDFTRGLLGVPGMNYSTMLRRSSNWRTYGAVFNAGYTDPFERPLVMGLIQLLWDRSEANGYAHHVTANPYRDTPAKQVLLFTAFGDYQVANVATGVMARTYGASVRTPALDPSTRDGMDYALWNTSSVEGSDLGITPFTGSALVLWDFGTPEPPRTNTAPGFPGVPDPHGLGGRVAGVRQMASEFLRTDGRLIDVCNGQPCSGGL
jgi:hypothetical protein